MKKTEHSRIGNYNVQVPKIGQGTVATEFLAQLMAALPKVLQGGRGVNVEYFGGKYIISAASNGRGGGGAVLTCVITGIASDYITCTSSVGTVNVARPLLLRKTGLDGNTITYDSGAQITYAYDATNPEWKRTANDGSSTITQVLTPSYAIDEAIYAIASNDTGVATAPTWVDLNVAGRHWAEQ